MDSKIYRIIVRTYQLHLLHRYSSWALFRRLFFHLGVWSSLLLTQYSVFLLGSLFAPFLHNGFVFQIARVRFKRRACLLPEISNVIDANNRGALSFRLGVQDALAISNSEVTREGRFC